MYGMFHWEEWGEGIELLKPYVSNYKINLVDAGNVDDLERFKTDLQQIFGMLKYRGEAQGLKNYMKENESYFKNIDLETYLAAREFLHSEKMLKSYKTKQNGKEEIDMCKALEDLYNSGIEQGVEQGVEQGIQVLIESLQEMGIPKEELTKMIQEKFSVSTEEAENYIQKYWKKI